jgi:hypothetical protein
MRRRAGYYGGHYKYPQKLVDTPTPCSCSGCGNPRRHWNELTIHERAEIERVNND